MSTTHRSQSPIRVEESPDRGGQVKAAGQPATPQADGKRVHGRPHGGGAMYGYKPYKDVIHMPIRQDTGRYVMPHTCEFGCQEHTTRAVMRLLTQAAINPGKRCSAEGLGRKLAQMGIVNKDLPKAFPQAVGSGWRDQISDQTMRLLLSHLRQDHLMPIAASGGNWHWALTAEDMDAELAELDSRLAKIRELRDGLWNAKALHLEGMWSVAEQGVNYDGETSVGREMKNRLGGQAAVRKRITNYEENRRKREALEDAENHV